MKLMIISMSLLLWIFCFQQFCSLGTVKADDGNKRDLFKSCNSKEECSGDNVDCNQGNCTCNDQYYYENGTCLQKRDLFKSCNSKEECSGDNVDCNQGNCTCNDQYYYGNGTCLQKRDLFKSCNSKEECSGDILDCNQGNCTCNDQYYYGNGTCLQKRDLFKSCNSKEECSGDNVDCNQGNCTCNDQYYYENGTCLQKRDLFKSCNSKEECSGDNVDCNQGNCTCNDQYYYGNGTCLKKRDLFESCNSKEECSGDNVDCNQGNCTCNDQYYHWNGTCQQKRDLFKSCNRKDECSGDNVDCNQGNCTCNDQYYHEDFTCLKKHDLSKSCNHTKECLGDHVHCRSSTCACKDKYYDKNGLCYERRPLFQHCDESKECLDHNKMVCDNHTCTCHNQYYHKDGDCHLRLDGGSPCQSNEMCSEFSFCKNYFCVCKEDYYFSKTTCFLKVSHGEICEANGCAGRNMYCNHYCKCKKGFEYIESSCQKKSSNAVMIVAVLLILFIVGLLIFISWKLMKQKSNIFKPSKKMTQLELSISNSRPILMSEFPEVVDLMHQDSNKIYSEQFLDLSRINPLLLNENSDLRSPTKRYLSCHEALKSVNASKNRFLDILPFDHSRVKLKPADDDDDDATDYINANYISGYSKDEEYIAAQGPLPNTGSDFWKMVWQENVSIVVMLTLCREKEMNKCDNYWPLEKGSILDFGDMTIETNNVTHYHSYDYRSMLIQSDDTVRSLKHFHFLQWADFSANVPVEILINFVQNVRSHITTSAPVVVHCSAGVGRTGTFIAVDYMLQFVDANPLDSKIDIFQFVSKMRTNRVHMVQNMKQYILIHDCIKFAVENKIASENGESSEANHYENQGFVTIDLTGTIPDKKHSQDLGSVKMMIEEVEEDEEENPYENAIQEKDSLCAFDSDENPYDIPEDKKELDEKSIQDLGSVQMLIEERKEEDNEEEENPYENEMQGVPNAEKDYLNDYDSDENPYDIPENAVLINKNKEDKQLDESNKHLSTESKPVTFEAEEAEEENPYENQEFDFGYYRMPDDSDEKHMLTSI